MSQSRRSFKWFVTADGYMSKSDPFEASIWKPKARLRKGLEKFKIWTSNLQLYKKSEISSELINLECENQIILEWDKFWISRLVQLNKSEIDIDS